MIKIMLLWICISIPTLTLYSANINGIVTDKNTGLAVSEASVQITELSLNTSTDFAGRYNFENISEGTYTLKITRTGFKIETEKITVQGTGSITYNASLIGDALTIAEIEVTTQREYGLTSTNFLDLKLRPTNTSQDILRLVPGLFIAQHAGGGKAEQIFLRGFDIDHGTDLYISVDGMPVNMVSHAHGQGYADLHFLIPETVDEFKVLKGPYSTKYGDFTTSGAVEFKTASSITNFAKLEYGRYNTYRGVGALNLLPEKNKSHKLYIASEYVYSDSYFESSQKFSRLNVFGKYHGTLSKGSWLDLSASLFTSHWNASGQVPERAVDEGLITRFGSIDDNEGGSTRRVNVNAILHNALGKNIELKNQAYYVNYNFDLYSNFTFFLNDPINGDQIGQNDKRNIMGYMSTLTIRNTSGRTNFKTVFGAGIRYDISDIYLAKTKDRITESFFANGKLDQKNISVYADELIDFSGKLSINPGVRVDYFNFNYTDKLSSTGRQTKNKLAVSPKLNLYYNVTPSFQLFAETGLGFHSNDARVVVTQQNENTLPKAFGYEAGSSFKLGNNFIGNVSLWGLNLESEFVYVGDEAVVEPSGRSQRIGVDVSARYQITKWLWSDIDLNFTHPRFIDEAKGEDYVPLAPVFTSIGGLSAQFSNGFSGSLRYRYLGSRPANEDYSVTADGYFIMDAVLNYRVNNYEFGITVENLLNNRKWNEAQFDTESRLMNESVPVSELHFTPGRPLFVKGSFTVNF